MAVRRLPLPPIGTKFNKLTTLTIPASRKNDRGVWITYVIAKCECGSIKEYEYYNLKNNSTVSCGCWRKIRVGIVSTKHGLFNSPIYSTWARIKNRCYNQNSSNSAKYKRYGDAGIKMCDEWKDNPQAFHDWAMANGYRDGLEIDRFPNRKGNYEPSNCRWANDTEQSRNRDCVKLTALRANHIRILYKYSGRSQKNIADLYGISQTAVSHIILNRIWV